MKKLKLTNKISIIVISSIVATVVILSLYFNSFLEDNFTLKAQKRILHGYNRLNSNIDNIKNELTRGVIFIREDENLLASIDLINDYQDKQNYNAILLDEEKKTIAKQLLDRVKISFNNDISLYDKNEELIAFVTKESSRYKLNYFSYINGEKVLYTKYEFDQEYKEVEYKEYESIIYKHIYFYDKELSLEGKPNITFQSYNHEIIIKSHQSVFDKRNNTIHSHIEMSKVLDQSYFQLLSKNLDIEISISDDKKYKSISEASLFDVNTDTLKMMQTEDLVYSAVDITLDNGTLYIVSKLNKTPLKITLNETKIKLAVFSLVIIFFIYFILQYFFTRSLANPLSRIMTQIDNIEDGNYSESITLKSGDEFEMISKNINDLAKAVNQRESSLIETHEQLNYLSNHDALTDLPNRRLFMINLQHALNIAKRNNTKVAILFIDLDEFKQVNDVLGHDVGDALLKNVAQRLRLSLRETDTLARIGGDEFNILLEGFHNIEDVNLIAGNIIDTFQQPFEFSGHTLRTTTSIGISIYPDDGEDSVTLIKNADLAMYQSKDRGKNKYSFFSSELSKYLEQRIKYINALKYALEVNNEFSLVYQPKISLESGKIEAIEALIRWNSKELGFVPPDKFISIAEETNMIIPVGKWVLYKACSDFIQLSQSGYNLDKISINISGVQLQNSDMVRTMKKLLQETGINPKKIELEITESYIATHEVDAIATLQELRDMNIELAIDDFGTGYSSMSYLQKLPVTRLKIDKSFIDGIHITDERNALVKAIISLAKIFKLQITAEGVETKEQVDFLKAENCDEIQGYYYSKPLSYSDLKKFINN